MITLEKMLEEIDDYYCVTTASKQKRKQKVLQILEKFFGKQEI